MLAANLRAALALSIAREDRDSEMRDEAKRHRELIERAGLMGDLRKVTDG